MCAIDTIGGDDEELLFFELTYLSRGVISVGSSWSSVQSICDGGVEAISKIRSNNVFHLDEGIVSNYETISSSR